MLHSFVKILSTEICVKLIDTAQYLTKLFPPQDNFLLLEVSTILLVDKNKVQEISNRETVINRGISWCKVSRDTFQGSEMSQRSSVLCLLYGVQKFGVRHGSEIEKHLQAPGKQNSFFARFFYLQLDRNDFSLHGCSVHYLVLDKRLCLCEDIRVVR